MKWFPNYFNVTVVNNTFLDVDQIEVLGHPYKLAHVDKETSISIDRLGIPEERGFFLYKELATLLNSREQNNKIDVLIAMEPHIKHINEFYMCTIFLEKMLDSMQKENDPLLTFLKDLAKGKGFDKDMD